jgi:DNA-binding response OmpR family regulator
MPKTVMVIEDDPDCLEVLSLVLTYQGYVVIAVADGHKALRALEDGPADLILLDMMLPLMDGAGFIAEQRARAALAAIPVVLLSGEDGLNQRASELGVAAAITKPVELDDLVSTVARLLAS